MASRLRIGIDFDNTIITYDDVFRAAAEAGGLIAPGFCGNKQAVRDAIRLLPDGELAWQRLQGQVYGKGIGGAAMVAGVATFLRIYFESTRAEKLARIAALALTHFIDDLEEVLNDPAFPPDVERILFADGAQPASPSYISCSTWRDIERQVFGGAGP
jgi:hypothetical protein